MINEPPSSSGTDFSRLRTNETEYRELRKKRDWKYLEVSNESDSSTYRENKIGKELEKLLELSEEVAFGIDKLDEEIQRYKTQAFVQIATAYLGATAVAAMYYFLQEHSEFKIHILMWTLMASGIFIATLGAFNYFSRQHVLRRMREKYEIEHNTLARLSSLIDQQLRRLDEDDSPVQLALLEIRFKRLYRRDRANDKKNINRYANR